MSGGSVAKIPGAGVIQRIYLYLFGRAQRRVVKRCEREFTYWEHAEKFIDGEIAAGRACRLEFKPWGFLVEVFA